MGGKNIIETKIKEVLEKQVRLIQRKKEAVIKERLKEIAGIDFDFNEEYKRRFKRLAIERLGDEERVYFNDGSVKGLQVVTFIHNELPIEQKGMTFTMTDEITYY